MRDSTPTGSATGSRPNTHAVTDCGRSNPSSDEGGLAGAVRADEAVNAAARRTAADIRQRGLGAVAPRDV